MVVNSRGNAVKGLKVAPNESILNAKATALLGEDFIHSLNDAAMRGSLGSVNKSARQATQAANAGFAVVDNGKYEFNSLVKVEGQVPEQNVQELNSKINEQVRRVVAAEKRPGGLLDPASSNRR